MPRLYPLLSSLNSNKSKLGYSRSLQAKAMEWWHSTLFQILCHPSQSVIHDHFMPCQWSGGSPLYSMFYPIRLNRSFTITSSQGNGVVALYSISDFMPPVSVSHPRSLHAMPMEWWESTLLHVLSHPFESIIHNHSMPSEWSGGTPL
ncbi:hypothetical protein HNY73_012015 [Argiope bruennichi]|uniref:Uncharacterized protein n=1 Tax=Argiope bruennichi TaxID=94029 RepID=A0A8T0EVM8_ARGBR|nr:hypothetical protein HNY73_012015 [Argiope bruennichi]